MIIKTVKFRANHQHRKRTTNLICTPSGCVNVFAAEFELGEPWQEYDKIYVVWIQGDKTEYTDLDDSLSCVIPAGVLADTGVIKCSLVGCVNGEKRLTTYLCPAVNVSAKSYL